MKQLNRKTENLTNQLPNKVLQFGGGNFLRAFSNWMIDELNEQTDFNAGVICVKPTEKGDYTALRQQEGLYHVLTKGIRDGVVVEETQLVTCIQQIIHPYLEWEAYLQTATEPSIKFIISNTTESGIQINQKDLFLDSPPQEFPAKLTRWLFHRWQYFQGRPESGCILLPCELIEQNGEQLRHYVLAYADLWQLEGGFKYWVNQHNHFCNTLVDRIVPGFPTENIEEVYSKLEYEDKLVVNAEPYHLWVIEASADIQTHLPFQQTNLNVVFTDDLATHRRLKVRILNGAHTSMVPVGYLAGIETVREAVEHKQVGVFIQQLLLEEVMPTLNYPKSELEKYALAIVDRLKNPFIHHQLISISLNSISKFKVRVLPSLLTYIEQKGKLPKRLCFAFAALLFFYRGDRKGQIIPLKDGASTLIFFQQLWKPDIASFEETQEKVTKVLVQQDFWEQDLNAIPNLATLVSIYLWGIKQEGILSTLEKHFK